MCSFTLDDSALDLSSLVGIMVGLGLLLPSFLVAEFGFLAVPAALLLLPSLLRATR